MARRFGMPREKIFVTIRRLARGTGQSGHGQMSSDYTQRAEAELLAEFTSQRSEPAFAELVRRHAPLVLGVCRRVLDDEHAAQDVAQAVFLALARKAHRLSGERALGGWLHHCALCAARNERTARARRLRREQEALAMHNDDAAGELTPATTGALREWLDRELDALPAKYRQPLVLVYLEGRTPEEAAAALRCKDGTLRVWLNRAKEKIRSRLARRGIAISVPALLAWLAATGQAAATLPPDWSAAVAKNAALWISGGVVAAGLAPNLIAVAKGALHTMFIGKLKTAAAITAAAAVVTTASAISWQKVYEARDKGLPKTAIEELKPILVDALQNQKYAEAIKALCMKIAMEGEVEGHKPEEKIVRLQNEIAKAPAEMRPMLEAILAHWYWQYFQQNRWRFHQRTQTAAAPGADIQTWDLARILAEIDKHYSAALAGEQMLKATPIAQFNDLLDKGTVPDAYRPTVFDFLAHEALTFYQAGEHGVTRAEDEFELDAVSPIFGDVAEFMRWSAPAVAEANAVRLFQNLLLFHQHDADRSAFLDADLARLTYGHNQAVGESKGERYRAALQRFMDENRQHEIFARACAALAQQLNEEREPGQAHALARRGLEAFSQSAGAALCFNLIQHIEAKSASLDTERVWNAPWPTLEVTYRNVTKVHFRAIAADFANYVTQARWNFGGLDDKQRKKLLATAPAWEWSADLPPNKDFKERTEKLPAPTQLKPGFYFIFASHNPAFSEQENQISVAQVWVSDLALVLQLRNDGQPHTGFVLQANSGEPVAGAQVRLWQRDREGWFKPLAPATSDEHGRFSFAIKNNNVVLLAEHAGHAVSSSREYWGQGNSEPEKTGSKTIFFTDRSLYRPGQTIHYKGIAVRFDQPQQNYSPLAGHELTVVFNDPNGKEIARAAHQCNDQGSFSGSFVAPRDRVMGRMRIAVQGRPSSTWIRVEEYKRPKFQVEVAAPAEAARLGSPVAMKGKATAYTGAAIGDAKVKWRVQRTVRFPFWCWWWQAPEVKAIAHGTATTAADGSFNISFVAEPDRAIPVKTEPVFEFTINADVTDSTGETRSAERIIRAGYTALQATLAAEDWQTPDQPAKLTVETKSLDGDPQAVEGKVIFYALKQPDKVERAALKREHHWWPMRTAEPPKDPANPDSWENGPVVAEKTFQTDTKGKAEISAALKAGIYRAALETQDRFGKPVTARLTVQVVDPRAERFGLKLANRFAAQKWTVEPGEKLTALWGTGYDTGRAFVEVECGGKLLKSYWTAPGRTQNLIEQAIGEEMRGGVTLRVTYIRENRAYLNERIVEVPWSNKKLTVKWETFRSKLLPGQKELWTALVSGPDAQRAAAEMVAALYDASLDQFAPHDWPKTFDVFRRERDRLQADFQNLQQGFQHIIGHYEIPSRTVEWKYRAFPQDILGRFMHMGYRMRGLAFGGPPNRRAEAGMAMEMDAVAAMAPAAMPVAKSAAMVGDEFQMDKKQALRQEKSGGGGGAAPDLAAVTARKNLAETAFFLPHLVAGADGVVRMEFSMPEALTEWKFLGFAHDAQLRAGYLTDKTITAKDLMVEPNPPRFIREGDVVEFTVKVSNQSDKPQSGKVRLTFADAATLKPVDDALDNRATEQSFDVPAKQSRSFSWRIAIPDGMGFLTYKAVGACATASDGEEGFLPVLSRRILVTESLPLPIRGPATKQFEFKKLLASGQSDTLRSQSLTVQMVSQPAWYAVMALPYLMEYPHECSEQIFNRFYANTLARHIAGSDPKIRRIFDLWKNTPALDSPLEKNQDLKSVMLEETPWLRQAVKESTARKNVGMLFDANRLESERARMLRKLAEQQLSEGLWPWFPGGRPSEYISLYIVTGFGRLRHLGAEREVAPAVKALNALDAWMTERHRQILKGKQPEDYVPTSTDALYLYGRSFFLKDRPVAKQHREAVDFFLRQARKLWLKVDCRQSKAHLAIALLRFDPNAKVAGQSDPTPLDIMKSIKEHSVSNEELGMFWRDLEFSWWWYRAPIETQALMVEAFAEIMNDAQAVEDCQVWLLKQKQTQDWKTTKATADAVYALLLRGSNKLASDALVEVALAGEPLKPEQVEAGTGFYEQRFVRGEIKPEQGAITVKKSDEGVSWGSVHWQYLEDMRKVTAHTATPLKLKKTLWRRETTKQGRVLQPVTGALAVGDEVVVRLELRTDRDMEYIHLKDQRGSGTEPVNVLSKYRFQDGLAYYESTRDTASHFFVDYLPKGVYVFEYPVRIQLKGRYQTGLADIQCMYAPEFNSHSESFTLDVR